MKAIERFGAVIVIALVLMLPIYSASAYAQLNSARLTGETGVDGFRKTNDFTRGEADIDGSSIQPSQVTINGVAFTSIPQATYGCTDRGNGNHLCYFQTPKGTATPNTFSYTIAYGGNSLPAAITVDGAAPTVSMNASQTGTNVTVTYNVQDTSGVQGKCAGIKKLDVLDGNTLLKTVDGTNPDDCSLVGSTDVNVASSGIRNICVRAYDNLWKTTSDATYVSHKCQSVNVDKTGPAISDVQIIDPAGLPIFYISNQMLNVKIRANVTEPNAPTNMVADASDLIEAQGLKDNYREIPMSCASSGNNKWICDSQPFQPILSGGVTAVIRITGEDSLGNKVNHTSTKILSVDSENPEAISITTDAVSDGISYIGPAGGTIVASFNEAVSGLSKRNIFADLSALVANNCCVGNNCGQACNQVRASLCEPSGGGSWNCFWNGVNARPELAHKDTRNVYLIFPSQDDAGNAVTGATTGTITVDRQDPVIKKITLTPSTMGTPHPLNYFLAGDSIVVTVEATDDTQIGGTADFSTVAPGFSHVPGTCTSGNICSFAAGPLIAGNNKEIKLMISDGVGNNITNFTRIDVLTSQNTPVVNNWEHFDSEVEISPSKGIDRQMIDAREGLPFAFVYAKVPLRDRSGGSAWPIFINAKSCSSVSNDYLPVLETGLCSDGSFNCPEVLNGFPLQPQNLGGKPYTIWLKYYFESVPEKADSFPVTCNISIISRSGNHVLPAENEVVTVNVKMYNNLLGEVSKSVKDEIKHVRSSELVKGLKWLDSLEKWLNYGKYGCSIYGLLIQVDTLIGGIITTLDICSKVPYPPTAAACKQSELAVQGGNTAYASFLETSYPTVNEFCKYMSCRTTMLNVYNVATGSKNEALESVNRFQQSIISSQKVGNNYFGSKWDPQHSLILSTLSGCVPGMVYNLQKARQIECRYINCLKETKSGTPIYLCQQTRGYMTCKYVTGELFNLVPYAAAYTAVANQFKQALKEPGRWIDYGITAACHKFGGCAPGNEGTLCGPCKVVGWAATTANILCEFGVPKDKCQSVFSGGKQLNVGDSECKKALVADEK